MFPNPQAALPLPPRPSVERYKKLAKELVKAGGSGGRDAIHIWAQAWVRTLDGLAGLNITRQQPVSIELWVQQVEECARRKLSNADPQTNTFALADAQFVIARSHGFESWPRFARHVEDLARGDSATCRFELAADAIVSGDLDTLQRLLRANPELIRARSAREHDATLLHYVSANGVEGYRQKTPKNAVQIAETLLKAGANVDAKAAVYGGGSTTLSLVATSIHPWRAGVQNALLDVLLSYGATLYNTSGKHNLIAACLANGRRDAAEFLASRGAPLDLESAAGVGRLDVVKSFLREDGKLRPTARPEQLQRGFLWACEYGRNLVVEFLLDHGADLAGKADTGQTGLHWAVIGGQTATLKLLLERKAPLEELNAYGGTALGQALWSFINGDDSIDYAPVCETLLAAGATMERGSVEWLEKQAGRPAAAKARLAQVLRRYGATT